MKQFLAAVLVAFCVLPTPVLAHGGRTDANGGHTDHSTGEYHYHHGYEAHQHPNGVCPYDFDDQTDHSSGTSSGSSSDSSWAYVDSRFFEDFQYNEATDQWLRDDGTLYESSAELFDCYGFYYDSGCDVWYNEDGFIDEDFCVRDHSDGGFFYCDSCENLMFSFESDDPDCHTGDCLDLDKYEDSYYTYDPSDTTESQDTSEKDDSPVKKWLGIIVGLVAIAFCLIPVIVWVILFVSSVISGFRSRKK